MKRDFFAQYDLYAQSPQQREVAVDYIVGKTQQPPSTWPALAGVTDPAARLSLLAVATGTPQKDYARVGRRNAASGLLYWYTKGPFNDFLRRREETYGEGLSLRSSCPDLAIFPRGAWALQFTFRLDQPYLSRDDTDFYILDNPVKKEWVFKLPYVAPSQWKGALRAALGQEIVRWWQSLDDVAKRNRQTYRKLVRQRIGLTRFFGNENDSLEKYLDKCVGGYLANLYRRHKRWFGSPTGLCAGRLHFYPTYFTQIGLEVLNPHSRDTGAGKNPILFECVPQGAEGTFTLLYVPLDSADAGESLADLAAVAEGLQAMMTLYGFGAKTSSGFGLAEEEVKKGALAIAMIDPQPAPTGESEAPIENPLAQLEADRAAFVHRFQLSDFPRWTNAELKASGWGKKRQSAYKRLRRRHPDWNESARTWEEKMALMESPPEPVEAASPLTSRDFDSFASLIQRIRELARAVAEQQGGAQ